MRLPDETLSHYDSIAEISGRMLEAARRNDWDAVILEEGHCRGLIDTLRGSTQTTLSTEEQQRKHRILRKVLADDAEIRNLAQPWLLNLEKLLDASSNNRKLDGSYGRQP